MFGLGFGEVLVILVVALLIFGPDKLPELARTLGKTMAELRRSMDEIKTEFHAPVRDFERSLRAEPNNPNVLPPTNPVNKPVDEALPTPAEAVPAGSQEASQTPKSSEPNPQVLVGEVVSGGTLKDPAAPEVKKDPSE